MSQDVFVSRLLNARARWVRALACSVAGAALSCAALAADAPQHRSLSFAVAQGAVAGIPGNTVNVQQGDEVELKWSSDVPMELHLHGYDIEVRVAPQAPATMSFKANIPGRFSIEQHGQGPGHHKAVLYLEVHP